MAKVAPFYSKNPTDPDVWHDENTCPPGNQIPWYNRLPGKGTYKHRKCKKCIEISG